MKGEKKSSCWASLQGDLSSYFQRKDLSRLQKFQKSLEIANHIITILLK